MGSERTELIEAEWQLQKGHRAMGLIDGPRPRRDGSTFIIFKVDTATGQELIAGQQRIVGAAKAEAILNGLRAQLRREDPTTRYSWETRPCSQVGRHRLAFGFRRD